MRIVSVQGLKQDMKLGKSIFSEDGKILLVSGTKLTKNYIRQLKHKNIPAVYIDDEISKDIEIKNVLDDVLRFKAVNKIKNIVNDLIPRNKNKTIMDNKQYLDVKNIIYRIINNMEKNKDILFNMVEMMSTDVATYNHMVNVAILSILVARELNIPEDKINEIATGAIIHDIGKLQIPPEILNKSQNLTELEAETIREHTRYGYDIIKDNVSVSSIVKTIVLLHHEKIDGSGYPMGLKGHDINIYTQIVSVCNMYDGMVRDRVYKRKVPIYKALEAISSEAIAKHDRKIYDALVKNITFFPQGSGVLLNTGQKGLVTKVNKDNPTRPKVKLVLNPDGRLYRGFKIVDLMEDLTLFVEDRCDIKY